jgi:tryptophan synthase alpha chain
MNAINSLFSHKDKNICSIYFTAGYPELNDTVKILNALQTHGADMIEIGMPYSDPLADGPVIQNSSMKALANGMTIHLLFEQLKEYLKSNSKTPDVPLILMGYLNPVLQYGFENFCKSAREAGVSGIILPDLPLLEYQSFYKKVVEENGLSFIFLVTPETSEERIRQIDALSNGFIYAVSSSSITGKNVDMKAQQQYFERIKNLHLKNPVLIGFGIRDRETFQDAGKYVAGAIIGTAYINALQKSDDIDQVTKVFLNSIL